MKNRQKVRKNMKNENYFVVHGWMRNELHLRNKELLVYAIIYGFSQVPGTKYTGSLKYLYESCGVSKSTILRILQSLCSRGLLTKETKNINGITVNDYAAVIPETKNSDNSECERVAVDDLQDMLNEVKRI
jgi:predicted transcriptional regulator